MQEDKWPEKDKKKNQDLKMRMNFSQSHFQPGSQQGSSMPEDQWPKKEIKEDKELKAKLSFTQHHFQPSSQTTSSIIANIRP